MEIDQQERNENVSRANRRTIKKLFLVAVLMFGFGYALVPMYQVICKVTGLNGKTQRGQASELASMKVDTSRTITVEFTGLASSGLPWEFKAEQAELKVHPGEVMIAKYFARNTSNESITGRATPSVAPNRAASHFKKLECFCFTLQTLKPGEQKDMPVRFYIDPKVPKDVQRVTLSYAFYNADAKSAAKFEKAANTHAKAAF